MKHNFILKTADTSFKSKHVRKFMCESFSREGILLSKNCIKLMRLKVYKEVFLLHFLFKVALSGLRQFLATERPLKMMKNVFYFTSKAILVLKIFKFLS